MVETSAHCFTRIQVIQILCLQFCIVLYLIFQVKTRAAVKEAAGAKV